MHTRIQVVSDLLSIAWINKQKILKTRNISRMGEEIFRILLALTANKTNVMHMITKRK